MAMTVFNVGCKAIIIQDGKVLLLKGEKKGRNLWDAPGGRIDDDETIQETLVRELHEELPGIQNIEIHELLSAFRVPGMPLGDKGLVLLFHRVTAEFPDGVRVSEEHDSYEWMPIDEIEAKAARGIADAAKRATTPT